MIRGFIDILLDDVTGLQANMIPVSRILRIAHDKNRDTIIYTLDGIYKTPTKYIEIKEMLDKE